MPRNASGNYSLPIAAYIAGTTIRSADMNSNLSDIATALTQSLATTGVSSMTGPIKLAAGSLGAPSLTLASDTTTGFYNNAAGQWTWISAGVAKVLFSAAGLSITGSGSTSTSFTVGTSMTVGTTLGVTGNTTLTTVTTSGLATLASLSVTGAATVGTTLGVTGATTLGVLGAGASTLASLGVTGAATVGTTLGVTGATSLSTVSTSGLATLNSLSVTGAATVGTTLGVTGTVTMSGAATVGTTFGVTGATTLTGALTVNNIGSFITATDSVLTARNSTNDSTEKTNLILSRGSGAGNTYTLRTLNAAGNDVTEARHYIGSTLIYTATAAVFSPKRNLSIDAGITVIATAGYVDLTEIAAPSNPAANINRYYSKDLGALSILFYRDSAGNERPLTPPGAIISRAYGEYLSGATLAGTIPLDDTIPQLAEGDEVISTVINIKYATSRIRVRVRGTVSLASGNNGIMAVFIGATADALAATTMRTSDTNAAQTIALEFEHAPATTGNTTYSLRSGTGGGTNYAFNSNTVGTRIFGGVSALTMVIEEIMQ